MYPCARITYLPKFVTLFFRARYYLSILCKQAPLSLPSNGINYFSTYLENERRCVQTCDDFWIIIRRQPVNQTTSCRTGPPTTVAESWPNRKTGILPSSCCFWHHCQWKHYSWPVLTFHNMFCNVFVTHMLQFCHFTKNNNQIKLYLSTMFILSYYWSNIHPKQINQKFCQDLLNTIFSSQ